MKTARQLSLESAYAEIGKQEMFKDFVKSIPEGTIPKGYDLMTLWESSGRPKDTLTAEVMGMFPFDKESGEYKLPTWDVKTGRWLTPFKKGELFDKELAFYNSDSEDANQFKKDYRLNTSGDYWSYDKREAGEVDIKDERGVTIGYKTKGGETVINKRRPVVKDGSFIGFYNTDKGAFEPLDETVLNAGASVIRINDGRRGLVKRDSVADDYVSQNAIEEIKSDGIKEPRMITKDEALLRMARGEQYKVENVKI